MAAGFLHKVGEQSRSKLEIARGCEKITAAVVAEILCYVMQKWFFPCDVLLCFSVLSTLTRWLVSSQRLQRLADIDNALMCRGYCDYCRLPNRFHSSRWQDYPQASSLLSEAVADKKHTM